MTCSKTNFIYFAHLFINNHFTSTICIYCCLLNIIQKKNIYYHIATLVTNLKMSNKLKEINIKNYTYYFYDNIINIKNLDPNNINIDEKPNKNIFIYYIGCVTVNDLTYTTVDILLIK